MTAQYEEKFAEFIHLCETAKKDKVDAVGVNHPEVLGDSFEELVESLNRLSDYGLALTIVPRNQREAAAHGQQRLN